MHELYWDSTYAIVVALMARFPHLQPEMVGLDELTDMVENLPGFVDDPARNRTHVIGYSNYLVRGNSVTSDLT